MINRNMRQENPAKASSKTSSLVESFSEHVADLLFQNERCCVSKAVTQLMEIVHATLKVCW